MKTNFINKVNNNNLYAFQTSYISIKYMDQVDSHALFQFF